MNAPVRIDLKDAATFPTRRVEDWKWTDLRRYLREPPAPSPAIAVVPGGPFASLGGEEIAFGNGQGGKDFAGSGVLRLRFVSQADGTGHQARVAVTAKAGESLLVLESYEGSGSAYVANAALTFIVEPGASLTRIVLLSDAADAISLSAADVTLSERAVFAQTVLASGAKLQRHETRVAHPGQGASARLDGVYVLNGERHADLTSVVEHTGVGGETTEVVKGAVKDRARGVFQGRIVVAHGADQTDARMGHHALILSERAEIDAKPELEIYADDVACAHGNTIGQLDQQALFYAMSRGIPEDEARAMLTAAFLGEVLDGIERDDVREIAQGWLDVQLRGL